MKYYKRILIFDVETNGLIPKNKGVAGAGNSLPVEKEENPYILQLSFIIYDPKNKQILKTANHYIRVADDVEISEQITTLTGIDRSTILEKGVPITHALRDFYEAYMNCDCIVAHNIYFDRKMMQIEIERNLKIMQNIGCINSSKVFQKDFQERHQIDNFCTMNYSRAIVKIERTGKNGETYYKSPKLQELYHYLFQSIPENLHDSMVDTYVCLRCFAKLKLKQDLPSFTHSIPSSIPSC